MSKADRARAYAWYGASGGEASAAFRKMAEALRQAEARLNGVKEEKSEVFKAEWCLEGTPPPGCEFFTQTNAGDVFPGEHLVYIDMARDPRTGRIYIVKTGLVLEMES